MFVRRITLDYFLFRCFSCLLVVALLTWRAKELLHIVPLVCLKTIMMLWSLWEFGRLYPCLKMEQLRREHACEVGPSSRISCSFLRASILCFWFNSESMHWNVIAFKNVWECVLRRISAIVWRIRVMSLQNHFLSSLRYFLSILRCSESIWWHWPNKTLYLLPTVVRRWSILLRREHPYRLECIWFPS